MSWTVTRRREPERWKLASTTASTWRLAPRLFRRDHPVPVWQDRRSRPHEQRAHERQLRDRRVGEADSQVRVLRVASEILEGEDGERAPVVRGAGPQDQGGRGVGRKRDRTRARERLERVTDVAGALKTVLRILLHAPARDPVERRHGDA